MGVSSSPEQLLAKLGALTGVVTDAPAAGIKAGAVIAKATIEAARASAGAASGRLGHVGKKGAAIGVRTAVVTEPAMAHGVVSATGPWPIIESDTPAHVIPKVRTRGPQHIAVIPGIGPRSVVHHPGTHGKHPWRIGASASMPLITEAFETGFIGSVESIF